MLFRTLMADLKVLLLADGQRTRGSVAVRDLMDVKRSQSMIWLCLMPILLFGMVIQGWHAHLDLAEGHTTPDVWQLALFNGISGGLTADSGFFAWLFYGASFVFPIFFVAFFVGLVWDMIFSRLRKETVQEGHLVVAILFALMLPVTIPLWLVAIGMSFAVVVGKQIFGGLGYNLLNPALVGLAFLTFAYPTVMSGDGIYWAVEGAKSPITLQALDSKGAFEGVTWYSVFGDARWWDAFFGLDSGAIGETSTLLILICGGMLLLCRLADWRIVLAVLIGMIATATMFNLIGDDKNVLYQMPWTWHLVTGGFALGMMFLATDPTTAPYTRKAKWAYGVLIGFMVVMIRVVNPEHVEGIMLAILFANLWSPLLDYFVARANIKRRQARNAL
ncbi:NADH:ubiquinone reductase (Na(+)-transporting) subunit B [Ferrimonas marina]|uniref:Na+-transporting NADH:ubiquinone oxidoreductase subunit B n=1 Tax=Ferrimonas marina TaxID=299255 RepID=A0A1M5YSW6_9GAMM|nr:NADH:ubiquinone reductase (Na(+)-transporting) subunit B [Ferrimonas marina]SHI15142.1 Na+-transporting NADH:ubiquinone oxidoreductase subunit B [Ferrimonas marina]